MKHTFSAIVFIGFVSISPFAYAETVISSDITTNATWTLAGSPYIVQIPGADEFNEVPLVVHATATLTIEPGVTVQFQHYNGMHVEGTLNALGTTEEPIYFTSMLGGFGGSEQWMHLSFDEGSVGNFAYATVEYGGQQIVFQPMTAIHNGGGSLTLDHVTMRHNGFDGYVQDGGSGTITNSDIHGHSIGVRMEGGELSISDTKIRNNEEGVSHRGGVLTITHSEIAESNIGINVLEEGSIAISNSSLYNNEKSILNQSEILDFEYDEDGNPINVIVIRPAVPVDARSNWWGSASGPVVATSSDAAGDIFGSGIVFNPFLTSDPFTAPPEPPAQTLGQQAANLAKQLINEPYLWGGKGWDMIEREFVSADQVKAGYNYWNPDANGGEGGVDTGSGLDCSGLVGWSYNRSADPNAHFTNNYIKFESADMQKKYGSQEIAESELEPGDLLFFDWDSNGRIDHVAEYVEDFNGSFNVVHAASEDVGIAASSVEAMKNLDGFVGFGRPISGTIAMAAAAQSPVHLSVTDPDGNVINHTSTISSEWEYIREAPGDLVYTVVGVGADGHPQEMVYSPILKQGEYKIKAEPITGAAPGETYSLTFNAGGQTITLAQDVPVAGIPESGYQVVVEDEEILLTRTLNASADTYIKHGMPNKNQGLEQVLRVRAAGDNRALVKFDVSEIPADANISSAKLIFTIADNKDNWGKQDGRTVGAYRLKNDWTELGATWNCGIDSNTANSNDKDCSGMAWEMAKPNKPELWPYVATPTSVTSIASGQRGEVSFDVTSDVQSFVSGIIPNNGWLIRKEKEGASGWVGFASQEAQNGPRLMITYE